MPLPYPSYDTAIGLATRGSEVEPMYTAEELERIRRDAENRRLQAQAEARTPALINRSREEAARAAGRSYYTAYAEPYTFGIEGPAPVTPPGAVRPPNAAATPTPPPPKSSPVAPDSAMTAAAAGSQPTTKAAPAESEADKGYHERVKAVRLPSGRIIFTNQPGQYEHAQDPQYRGTQVEYGEAMEDVTGRPWTGGVNIASGPYGTIYAQPGGEVAAAAALPGPAASLESSLPELTDPVAIYERQQWLEAQKAEEQASRVAEAQARGAEAEASSMEAQARIDPLAAMQAQAEARYGGQMIRSDQERQETLMALRAVATITQAQNEIRQRAEQILKTQPQGPQRDATLADLKDQIDRMESDKKLYLIAIRPQAAAGLMRPDPYAAFAAMPPPGGETAKR